MKARSWLAATVLGALLSPSTLRAEGMEGRLSIAFQAGTQSELAGVFLRDVTGTLLGKPVTLESKRYRDVYAPDLRVQGLLGYGITARLEVVARGTWYKAEGTNVELGKRDDKAVYAILDAYGGYEERGLEVGLRFYVSAAGRLKSYVAAIGGARSVSETYVSFEVPDAGTAIRNVPLHAKGTVPLFGLDIGFTFDLGEHVFVGLDTGLRHHGPPPQADGLADLASIDDSDGRWSSPVAASIGVRF